jgi:alpha-mannosidase
MFVISNTDLRDWWSRCAVLESLLSHLCFFFINFSEQNYEVKDVYKLKLKHKMQLERLYSLIDSTVSSLSIMGCKTKEPIPFEHRTQGDFREYRIGESWGDLFDCAWFHLRGKVPLEALSERLYLKLDFNCELCLFDQNGLPIKGFTNKSSAYDKSLGMPTKRYFIINEYLSSSGDVDLWIDAGLNDLFGELKNGGKIECAEIVKRDLNIRKLYYDLETLLPLYPKQAKRALNLALKEKKISEALQITQELLNQKTKNNHIISAIGHSHIDLAWLWPLRETKRKAARTFSNVLYLMKLYPEFKFGASQAQLYQWVKEDYPLLYEKIKEKIKEGRWEVQGGMWVEPDTNLTSGESLVRQMLYGIRFFKEEFGIRVKNLWLPDVFGYSGALPQIIKKSGLEYFMTTKLSWNRNNKFPYHTFNWLGIDGSSVLAHMPPEGTYNSPITPAFAYKSQKQYREKKISNRTLNLFGIGDGGGGPGTNHCERLIRLKDLAPLPKVVPEFSSAFFDEIAKIRNLFPKYQGELYLEYHRGTYTSQSINKYYNRLMEQKLKTVETMLVHAKKHREFKEQLESIWKEVLLYQFHDILPGSSIKRVYDESLAGYQRLEKSLNEILIKGVGVSLVSDMNQIDSSCIIYNPLPRNVETYRIFDDKLLCLKGESFSDTNSSITVQKKENSTQTSVLENALIRIDFSKDGSIQSIFDKEKSIEILRSNGNQLKVHRDSGNAWNILPNYWWFKAAKPTLIAQSNTKFGDIPCIEQHYKYANSIIIQKIFIHPNSKLIEFDTDLDWHDSRRMLRTCFPLSLKTDHAVFDIAFGNLARSTLNKNSIEKAQWEVSGHKWVDLSNGSYGVALITDSKYGFRVKNNTLDLNMLRATVTPGKEGDLGKRHFRYAILIHDGDHNQGKVDWIASVFNTWFPIYLEPKFPHHFCSISAENIDYSTMKSTEDGNGYIIRLYEKTGQKTSCVLTLHDFGEFKFMETNLVEENEVELGIGSVLSLEFEPFEIKTIKLISKR